MEESTYFCYAEGFNPWRMHLGSLVFDYANPRLREPYIHNSGDILLQQPPQATGDHRPVCYLAYERGKSSNLGTNLEQLLEFEVSHAAVIHQLVVGKDGSKVELSR
jgi:hypothetical protein